MQRLDDGWSKVVNIKHKTISLGFWFGMDKTIVYVQVWIISKASGVYKGSQI